MKNVNPVYTALALTLLLAGCAQTGAVHQAPAIENAIAFKEGQGVWVTAAPADALDRGTWWELFDDPMLSELAAQVEVSNQNVAAAWAAYMQARAITAQQRAQLFPQVSLDTSTRRTGTLGGNTPSRSTYSVGIGGSWEPDVFGRIALGVERVRLGEQVSEADLASARLAAQGELAINYFGLREMDIQRAIQAETITGYERSLQITRNRYEAGVVARTDVLQAETQLTNAQAEMLTLERQRAVFEHAIAVLVGRVPANFLSLIHI